jgi:hypothetical protein
MNSQKRRSLIAFFFSSRRMVHFMHHGAHSASYRHSLTQLTQNPYKLQMSIADKMTILESRTDFEFRTGDTKYKNKMQS